jgi:hypothetical protein
MGLQYGFSHVGFPYVSENVFQKNVFQKPDLIRRSLQHPVRSAANHIQVLAIAGDMAQPIHVQQYAVCH